MGEVKGAGHDHLGARVAVSADVGAAVAGPAGEVAMGQALSYGDMKMLLGANLVVGLY